jgi:hypothetical protein
VDNGSPVVLGTDEAVLVAVAASLGASTVVVIVPKTVPRPPSARRWGRPTSYPTTGRGISCSCIPMTRGHRFVGPRSLSMLSNGWTRALRQYPGAVLEFIGESTN